MAVARLGSASSSASNAAPHTIGAGSQRCLMVAVTQEVASPTQLTVGYGGQTMSAVVGIAVGDATDQRVDIYFLNDAGITAASDNQIDVTSPPATFGIFAQSYTGAAQTTPTTVDSEALTGDSDPLTNIQISATAGTAVFGVGGTGNLSTGVTWAGTNPLTALANLDLNGTAHGAIGDRLSTGTETVNHNLTFTTAPNRVAGAACLIPAGTVEPIITDVETDEEIDDKQTAVTITGSVFESPQGTGKVEISDNATYGSGNVVAQTETSWGATAIDITVVLGAMAPGTPRYLWVTNDSAQRNTVGFVVHVHRAHAFGMAASGNIAASGENTTFQLAAPATKSTTDFDGGRIQDDENPGDAVNVTTDNYREDEWCIEAVTDSEAGGTYQFRILLGGVVPGTLTVDPRWTISTPAASRPNLLLLGVG